MKKVSISIAMLATAASVAAVSIPAHAKSKTMRCTVVTPAQVEAQFEKFNNAWATKDPATVTGLFTKDAVLLPTVSNTPRTTTAGINDYFVKFLKSSPVGTINTSTVKIGCNEASRLGTWSVALTDAATGVTNVVNGRYSFIYKLEGKEWKIDHLHSSLNPETAGK